MTEVVNALLCLSPGDLSVQIGAAKALLAITTDARTLPRGSETLYRRFLHDELQAHSACRQCLSWLDSNVGECQTGPLHEQEQRARELLNAALWSIEAPAVTKRVACSVTDRAWAALLDAEEQKRKEQQKKEDTKAFFDGCRQSVQNGTLEVDWNATVFDFEDRCNEFHVVRISATSMCNLEEAEPKSEEVTKGVADRGWDLLIAQEEAKERGMRKCTFIEDDVERVASWNTDLSTPSLSPLSALSALSPFDDFTMEEEDDCDVLMADAQRIASR